MRSFILYLGQHQQNVIKMLIIFGVLGFSFLVGRVVPSKYLSLFLVSIFAFGGFIIYVKYPQLGLLAIISVGLLVSFEIGTSTNTNLNIVVILLPIFIGVWFIDRFVRQQNLRFISSRTNLPLIAFIIACILAFGIGQLTWFYYARQAPLLSQIGGLAIFVLSAGAYLFTANVITHIKWLKNLTWVFLVVGMIILFFRIFHLPSRLAASLIPSGSTGSLFWIWIGAIAYSQLISNNEIKLPVRILLAGVLCAMLFISVYLGYSWKSGWIPPLVGMGVITWLRFRRLRYLLTIGGVILVWFVASELIQSDQYSYVTRVEAWKIVLNEIIRVNPVFGLGPANYRFYTPLFPIMGYWVEFNSHNNYIDVIAQIGVLGLLAFVWFAWEVWRQGWGLLRQDLDGFSNAYVLGAMGGLVGMLVAGMLGDWVIPFVYNVGLDGFRASVLGWIFLGGLAALHHIQQNNHRDHREVAEGTG